MAAGRAAGPRPEWGTGPQPAARAPRPPQARAPQRGQAPKVRGKAKNPKAGGPRPKQAPARRPASPARPGAFRSRYGIVHDTDGPKVRMGLLWFVTAVVAIIAGPLPTAIVYGAVAAAAAAQAARTWNQEGVAASDLMAGGGAALMAAGALFGAGGAGLGIIGCVVLAFVAAAGDSQSAHPRISDIGYTLQCALAPGVVAMCVVLTARYDQGSAIALLLLASAFEAGDFLIGTSAKNPYEGPGAGAAGLVVVTFIVSTLPVSTLSFGEAWALGGSLVVLAPLGQMVASAVLPAAASPAPALRRFDTLLLAAPIWAWAVGMAIGN